MKKVYHEYWGELTPAQLALYKAKNVSASDHDILEDMFGDDVEALINYVKRNSTKGYLTWGWHND